MLDEAVPIEAFLDDEGLLDHRALRDELATGDVGLGTVTDEVLLLCGDDPLAMPRPHWTPWLAARDPRDVDVARTTAARFLLSKGMLWPDEADELRLEEPLATLSRAMADAVGLVTVQVDVVGEEELRAGFLVLPDGVVLHDQIDAAAGTHELHLRRDETASAWLAALLDPAGCATDGDSAVVGTGLDEVLPSPDVLPGELRSRTAAAASRRRGEEGELEALTGIGTTEGWWLVQGRTEPEPVAFRQRRDEQGIRDIAVALLTRTIQ